jgi:hypothetical protein
MHSASITRYLQLLLVFFDELAVMVKNKVESNVTATCCIDVRALKLL